MVIGSRKPRPLCVACGGSVWSKGYRSVVLVDLPAFGRPVRLRWRKRRWTCPNPDCALRSFIEQDPTIGPQRALLTSRAARWVTIGVGGRGRSVDEVAAELGCDWHTVNKEVGRWGDALLEADTDRVGTVEAVGVDETLFWRRGRWRTKVWCTSVVDVGGHQLIDIVAGRTAESAAAWFRAQPTEWCEAIRWAVLDMSGSYRKAYDRVLPHALQVADPFHVIRLANQRLDEVRRRTQNETLGHRGRKDDPLYRIRRLLTAAHERISDRGQTRLRGLLDAGDPHGEVRTAWHAKETVTRHLRDRQPRPRSPIHPPARRRPPTRILPTRDQQARTYHRPLDPPDHQLAHLQGNQRTHRSAQQPHQTDQTSSVRVTQLRELPNPRPSLRGETQLGPTPIGHSPLKSDEPDYAGRLVGMIVCDSLRVFRLVDNHLMRSASSRCNRSPIHEQQAGLKPTRRYLTRSRGRSFPGDTVLALAWGL